MRNTTLCIVKRGSEILLGMKKSGLGSGKYNSFGGKVEPNETIHEATVRELLEESGIKTSTEHLKETGKLTFVFPEKTEWSQIVHVFIVEEWSGNPIETDEMIPKWFEIDKIPYDKMWESDILWLPHMLEGKKVNGEFLYSADQKILKHSVNTS